MELILEVTNPHVADQSFSTSHRFREAGGVIGRGSVCNWQLPDPSRYLSNQHAAVEFEDGVFYLVDLSTNGVFVNGSPRPLGKHKRHAVANNEQFGMGRFQIRATLWADAQPATSLPPSIASFFDELEASMPAAGHHQLAEQLSTSAFKAPATDETTDDRFLADELEQLNWALDSIQVPNLIPAPQRDHMDTDAELEVLDRTHIAMQNQVGFPPSSPHSRQTGFERMTEGLAGSHDSVTHAKKRSFSMTEPKGSIEKEAIDAFLESAGLSANSLQPDELVKVMSGCGLLMRSSVKSLMELLALRTEQKNRHRVGLTLIRRQENNPLKHCVNEVQAIKQFVVDPQPECLSADQALQQAVVDLGRHIDAIESAYQELIREVIDFVAGDEEGDDSARRGWMDRRAQKRALQKRLDTLRDDDIMRREFFEHRFSKLYQDALAGIAPQKEE